MMYGSALINPSSGTFLVFTNNTIANNLAILNMLWLIKKKMDLYNCNTLFYPFVKVNYICIRLHAPPKQLGQMQNQMEL